MDHISRLRCNELSFDENLWYFKWRVSIVRHGQMRAYKDMDMWFTIIGTPASAPTPYFPLVSKWPIFRFTAQPPPPADDRKRAIEMTTDSFRMRRMLHVLGFS